MRHLIFAAIFFLTARVSLAADPAILTWDIASGGSPTKTSGALPTAAVSGISGTVITDYRGNGLFGSSTWYDTFTNYITAAVAQTAGNYFCFSTVAGASATVTISGFSGPSLATLPGGPTSAGLFYSVDDAAFTQVGSTFTLGTTLTSAASAFKPASPITIAANQTGYWRIVLWNSSSISGSGLVGIGCSGTSDFALLGTVGPAKLTTTITTVPMASVIAYGQTLASSNLSGGVASVPGIFSFTTPSTAPIAGTASQGFTFTPTDAVNYYTATGSVSVVVSKATPTVMSVAATGITYGAALSSSTLSGTKSTPGTLAFTLPSTVPSAGTANQAWTFTPTDSSNYNTATGTVSMLVSKANPTITTAPIASSITYGQTLASSTLSGGVASVPGTFAFTALTTAPSAGTASQGFTFIPTDTTNYSTKSGTVSVTVDRITPTVTWPASASAITYGTALSTSTLSGGSGAGSFAFTSPTTTPNVGTVLQGVTFTPTDTVNYETATGTVSVTVNQATPAVTWPTSASEITYGAALSSSTLSGGSGTGSFAFTSPTMIPNAGTATQGVTFRPTDTLNYTTATGTISVSVNKAAATVNLGSLAQTYDGSARTVTANTIPAGLAVDFTYDGSATVPINAGTYAVIGTIDDLNYTGSANGTLVVTMPIAITSQPSGVTVNQGGSATFSVTATGTSPTYQWKKAGVAIGGATGATLTLNNIQPADAADYTVVVTNAVGSVTSGVASLTVIPTAWTLYTAAESALALADASAIKLDPIRKLSVVTGVAAHSGVNALKFETVDDGSTYAERTIVGPAVVSFAWRVSSEENYDFFNYSVDGVQREAISGNGTWLTRSLTLASGTHTIRWTYRKDSADGNFEDAGYLDDVVVAEAYTNLEVRSAGSVVTGNSSLAFGTSQQNAAEVIQTLEFKNTGTVPQDVVASLPEGCGFVFDEATTSYSFTLGADSSEVINLVMQTIEPGTKSGLLEITAAGSKSAAPAITLSGDVQAIVSNITCNWSGGAISSGQGTAVDFGAAPRDLEITVNNTGSAALAIASVSVSPASDFEVTSQPASTVAVGGSTTFTLRAFDTNRGNHTATVTIASNDDDTPYFTFPLASKSYLAVAVTAGATGSFSNSGTTIGWDLATTTLANGSSGQAIKTGATPNSGDSTIGATFEGPGLLSWNWNVSAQQGYDWLLCEVNGTEVAGISTKTAAWQSQVVQIPAGSQVRWIYRKDATSSAGTDSGYLSDISFSKFTATQSSFQDWSAANGNLTPTQLIPAGGMQAMFAWLGGVDPTTGPATGQFKPSVNGGLYKYRYTVAKAAAGIVQPQISTDLVTWNSRKMKQTLISEDDASAVVELSVPATGKVFSRFAMEMPVYTAPVVVPAGFVLVAAGALPSSSDMGAQNVAAFYMAQTETTWGQWQTVRAWAVAHGYDLANVGAGNGDSFPVTNVSWYQIVKWCNARSEMEGLTPVYTVNGSIYRTGDSAPDVNANANGYRLPGEAEWEFAARGGVNTNGYDYSGSNDPDSVAWHNGNSGYTTHSVATKQANELGLSDMSGNVWEWCYDWTPGYEGSFRVYRGGGWGNYAHHCRVDFRNSFYPSHSDYNFGFRVARSSVP